MGTNGLLQQEGYDLMAAAFEVYKQMGPGFLEAVYQECLERELHLRKTPFEAKPQLPLRYKNETLLQTYQPDLLVYGEIMVELKSVRALVPEHEAQLLNYLKASNKRVGYLLNFASHSQLEWKRMVL